VRGISGNHDGVQGFTKDDNRAGVVGSNTCHGNGLLGQSDNGVGVHAIGNNGTGVFASGGTLAGDFAGTVVATGDIIVQGDVKVVGGNLAEQFGVVGTLAVEPGCAVVLAGDDCVRVSDRPYDRRVAGVVSGAGSYRPASSSTGRPTRIVGRGPQTGKVWCKVDGEGGPVELGHMLTTFATPGHAPREPPIRAERSGAVIGKALRTLQSGRGLVPVLGCPAVT
jgi:hypothetical protein